MKLHAPKFEKALRKQVKRTVRSSRELKREFRRVNRYRRQSRLGWVFRPFYGCLLGYLAWLVGAETGHLISGLAVINLWMLMLLCFHTQGLWSFLYASPDLHALHLLPVPRNQMFRWELQKYFRSSAFALIDLSIAFGVLAFSQDFPPTKWAAAFLIAVLSWLMLVAMAAFAAARLPRWPFQIMSGILILLGLVLFIARTVLGDLAVKVLDQCAPVLNLILPTGWAASLFQLLPADKQWWPLFLLVPIAAIIWTIKDSRKRLLLNFKYQEQILAVPSDLVPGEEAGVILRSKTPVQLGPTAIEEIIQSRKFLCQPVWPQRGWLEQWLWRWLDQRERSLSEFVFPNGLSISTPWKSTFRNLMIAAGVAFGFGFISPTWKLCALGLGLFVTVCQTLAQTLNQGRAFQPMSCSGVNIPIYAGFGIGFRELSRLLLKYSIIQIPLLLAFAMTSGVLTALLTDFPALVGLVFGLKFGGLLFAGRFISVAFAFSSGTNDNTRLSFRSVFLVLSIVIFGLLFLGLGGAGLFLPDSLLAWSLWAGALLDAYVFYWIYSWFYNLGRFDLMSLPRR